MGSTRTAAIQSTVPGGELDSVADSSRRASSRRFRRYQRRLKGLSTPVPNCKSTSLCPDLQGSAQQAVAKAGGSSPGASGSGNQRSGGVAPSGRKTLAAVPAASQRRRRPDQRNYRCYGLLHLGFPKRETSRGLVDYLLIADDAEPKSNTLPRTFAASVLPGYYPSTLGSAASGMRCVSQYGGPPSSRSPTPRCPAGRGPDAHGGPLPPISVSGSRAMVRSFSMPLGGGGSHGLYFVARQLAVGHPQPLRSRQRKADQPGCGLHVRGHRFARNTASAIGTSGRSASAAVISNGHQFSAIRRRRDAGTGHQGARSIRPDSSTS